jgi:hypothetical protein
VDLPTKKQTVASKPLILVGQQSRDENSDCFSVPACDIDRPFYFVFELNSLHVNNPFDGHVICFQIVFSFELFIKQLLKPFVEIARAAQVAWTSL